MWLAVEDLARAEVLGHRADLIAQAVVVQLVIKIINQGDSQLSG